MSRGIYSLRDLSKITERELARMPGIGSQAINRLKLYLRKEEPTVKIYALPRALTIIFKPSALTAIDAWASSQEGVSSRAEAIRRLVEIGLAAQPNASAS